LQVPRIGPYEKSEVVDESTVKVYFKEAFPSFLSNVSEVALAPCSPDAVKKLGDKYARFPVGAGPFKVKEWPNDNTIILERFNDYKWAPSFMNHQGPAYLEQITINMVEEQTTRYVALQKGDALLMDGPPPDEVTKLQKDTKYYVDVQPTPGMPSIMQFNVTRMPTKELAVRQAMLYAINREQIASLLSFGVNKAGNGPLTRAIWGYDPAVEKMYPFDPANAKKILEDAGWKVNAKTGIREKGGQPCKMRFVARPGADTQAGELVQAMLKDVGINFVIDAMAYEATVVRMAANDYEVGRLGYTLLDPHDVFYLAFHSSQVEGGGQFNRSRIKDKKMDELIEAGSKEIDQTKRLTIYKELQKIVMDQALILPIQETTSAYVMLTKVKGFKADSLGRPWLYNVWIE
jgi:peptide/nickel transport system substrate-binding protein